MARHCLQLLALAVVFALPACRDHEATGLTGPCGKVGIGQAEQLVREWVYEVYEPEMNPAAEFPLEEITPDRVWKRLSSQIYTCQSTTPGMGERPLLIECEDVFDLGALRGFGGQEVRKMKVTDLDADGNHELVFLDTWGSGIVRTQVDMYLDDGEQQLLLADMAFRSLHVALRWVSDQELNVVVPHYGGPDDLIIGRVVLLAEGEQKVLTIELADYVPGEVVQQIWFDYGL